MVQPPDLDRLSHAELKSLVISQFEMIAESCSEQLPRCATSPLKGGPGRPDIKPNKPSGMEKATDPKPQGSPRERAKRGPTRTKLTINEEKVVKVAAPAGSRFSRGCLQLLRPYEPLELLRFGRRAMSLSFAPEVATVRPPPRIEQPETVQRSAGGSAQWALLVEGLPLAPPPCDKGARSNVRAPASQPQVR
jgi:hypothetical protein